RDWTAERSESFGAGRLSTECSETIARIRLLSLAGGTATFRLASRTDCLHFFCGIGETAALATTRVSQERGCYVRAGPRFAGSTRRVPRTPPRRAAPTPGAA